MALDRFPAMNASSEHTPWVREAQKRIISLESALDRAGLLAFSSNQSQNGSLSRIGRQIRALSETVELLASYQVNQYSEFTTTFTPGVVGFTSPVRASVSINSPTGRIEIGYGGSLNGGAGYFCYQIQGSSSGVIVSRTDVQTNPAQRVGVTGGASFVGSGFNNGLIITVPPNEDLTITLQLYASDTFVTFFGGKISAKVSP